MKHFLRSKGLKATAIALTVILAIVLASVLWGGGTSFLASGVRVVTGPIERALFGAAGWTESVIGSFKEFQTLKAENAQLQLQLAEMEAEIRLAKTSNDENARLRTLLGLVENGTDFETVTTASVISYSPTNWSSSLVIGAGSVNDVEVGDCIITAEGFLVGQVTEVGATNAQVRTVIDLDSSIGALVDRNGVSGIASGDFELMRRGVLRLGYLPVGSDLLNGDTVLSSGKGEAFPAGLVIGKISAYRIDDSGMNWYGEVTPSADLNAVTQIFVVR
ncbi:MAG: rod shape-determining protein MreC [Oscillospiraceae bacterium]|jgi:rod shape-determining protein MreC|nr:rod shape-determining protein MreC [Oscillospiraceae bacterium]